MRLLWNFVGDSARHASRVQGLQTETFQIGFDGALALPARGDLLNLNVNGLDRPVRFVCVGRRFDVANSNGPVLRIDLDVAPPSRPSPGADAPNSLSQPHSLSSVR
jgi:hypothetical protein